MPDGGAHPISTRNHWALRCLGSLNAANGATGEGFIAVSPDGTQYRFDWLVSRRMEPLTKSSAAPNSTVKPDPDASEPQLPEPGQDNISAQYQLNRVEVWILPTLVTDRHGNTVTYTYDTTNKWQLKSIEASDASGSPRKITLTYKTPGSTTSNLVATVSDGTRTWSYNYSGLDVNARLQSVVLPDQSRWQLDNVISLLYGISYLGSGSCDDPGFVNPMVLVGSMTHPSGAVGEFTLTPTRHGRAGVQNGCRYDLSTETYFPDYPNQFDSYSLTKKTITGPGLPGYTWQTSYSAPQPSWAPCNGCVASKTVTVTDPEGRREVHTFGTLFQKTEGQLQQLDVQSASGETLRSTMTLYHEATAPFGQSLQGRGDGELASRNLPVNYRKINQQGVDFVWWAKAFNDYGQPSVVERASALGNRTETIAYQHNTARWILNRVATVTESSGKVMVSNLYDANLVNLLSVSRFGKLQQTLTYYSDGNVQTESDGKSQVTTFSNYKRGIPQNIRYHNNQTKSAVVSNIGMITSLTNEAGFTTAFGYDTMGRLGSVTHPAGGTVAWAPTTLSTWQASSGQFDLAAGHWRQQVATGTARTVTYYDALLRPIYVEHWDDSDVNGSLRTLKYGYDFAGRTNFESYPRRTYGQVGPGVYYAYDALGRETAKAAKSEVGEADGYAWTRTSYESGFRTAVRDPRQNLTTYSYQAFDEPVYDNIAGIVAPENVVVTIGRDVFGKPTAITRGNNTKSVTRRYVYDSAQRLCKTIEPESGATVRDYDGADNVLWRASGLALPSTTSCDTASVPAASKVTYQYDTRNRPTGSTYGDSSPAIAVTLTPDGLPNTVSSNGAVWTNTYNNRRLLERESLAYGGATYNIGRGYDANGSLSQLTYPDNTSVPYSPNALGEPRQIGAYANAIAYHPNGGIASFNYGSTTTGIKHSTTQNERGLPVQSTDSGGVRDDLYGYDASANVAYILDLLPSNVSSRSMTYDGLDRLRTTSAPNLWGSVTYAYDAVDNLIATTITGGISARNTLHNINATTNRLDSIGNGPAGFNVSYAYDVRGNVTQRSSQVFEYDLGDRMKRAVGRATYTYDGYKRRVSVVGTDGVTRVQVYAQDGKLLYIAPSGGTPTKYVYLRNHVLAEVSGSTVTYNHTDALGSPVAQTNAAGAVLSRTRYEPYGYIVAGTPRTIGFTGHVNDNDTGLVYMQQRYYDAVAGRFLSVDPVVTDANSGTSFNRYAYANNSPYQYVDPDGRAVDSITMDKNRNIHIIMGISYRGGGITSQQAASLNAGVIAKWSGKFGPYTVRMTIIPGSQARFGNIVTIKSGTGLATTNGNNGRETTLFSKDGAGNSMQAVLNHEVGHMIGMKNVPADRYNPSTGVPVAGWEGNIMADANGNVDERNIVEMVTADRPYLPSSATNGTGQTADDSSSAGIGYTCRTSGSCFN